MKISDIISEAPIPDDWDTAKFAKPTSFREMVAYAKERSKQLGVGSSRVAFEIPYQGRETVLKVAKNNKGIAQNKEEITLFSDYIFRGLEIAIPVIDWDEVNEDRPTWIHVEKAQKITNKQMSKFLGGVDLQTAISHVNFMAGKSKFAFSIESEEQKERLYESELFNKLIELAMSFPSVIFGDLMRVANWGLYNGSPVIIDIGFTTETEKLYFK